LVRIKPLSSLPLGREDNVGRHMNVCIVSSGFLGPVKNGGIGTATSGLARQLVSDGHHVTILYTYVGNGKPVSGDKPWQYWVTKLAEEGITLQHIPLEDDYRAWRTASWLVKEFIGEENFDLVYFDDHFGSGYYSLLAKRAGLEPFCHQLHCLITHGSVEWIFNINDYYASRPSDVEWMGLERRSVELADVVLAPSDYLLREYEKYGWALPVHTYHQPYPIFGNQSPKDFKRILPITELVFFGRLEVRKGLWLFCEALERLAERFPDTDVTFMGRVTEFSGISSALQIVNRSAQWPYRTRLFSDFDQDQALSYLRSPGKLAVMPSLADNSPCAVYECMEAGIPFVSTLGSGIEELIDQTCWDAVLVEPSVKSLTNKLSDILERGAQLAKPGFDPDENLRTWSNWHRFVSENREAFVGKSSTPDANIGGVRPLDQTVLIVVIDNGNCALGLLVDNISVHLKRFGGRAKYLVLSVRSGELREIITEILDNTLTENRIAVFDVRAAHDACEVIRQSSFVFFIDAETELLSKFFVAALDRVQRCGQGIISCIVATRSGRDETADIQDLPAGIIPGLAALGEPIGGAVWATSSATIADCIGDSEIYDAQADALTSSSALGQLMMMRCQQEGASIDILPIVGAIVTIESEEGMPYPSFDHVRRLAKALSIEPSIYQGRAPWFTISACGAHLDARKAEPIECMKFLPSDHPANSAHSQVNDISSAKTDLPALAAALGRPELALQLEAADGPAPDRLRHLTDVAIQALRSRPDWDVVDVMTGGNVFEFGVDRVPVQRSFSGTDTPAAIRSPASSGRVYVDGRRLRMTDNNVQGIADLSTGAGKVIVFDVPLCGNSEIVTKLHVHHCSKEAAFGMRVIDQRNGGQIGSGSMRLSRDLQGELTIPLYDVYVKAALVFEFSETADLLVRFDAVQIH
jgi:glycosyltransferase involved in cell wall biosynthesis